jgi:hypothetical protein
MHWLNVAQARSNKAGSSMNGEQTNASDEYDKNTPTKGF